MPTTMIEWNILIIILCIFQVTVYCQSSFGRDGQNHSQLVRMKRRICTPFAKIKDCPPTYNMYVMMTYVFSADVRPGCSNSKLDYKWEIRPLEYDYKKAIDGNEELFIIPELSATQGKAEISLKVTETIDRRTDSDIVKCFVEYQKEPPIAIIDGGDIRTVAPNIEYTVNATTSINFGIDNLQPIWSVECINHTTCSPQNSFVCPKADSGTGLIWSFNTQTCVNYKINLKLKYNDDPKKYPTTQQTLSMVMDPNVEIAHLKCLLNCMSDGYINVIPIENSGWNIICDSNCPSDEADGPDYELQIIDKNSKQTISNTRNTVYYKNTRMGRLIIVKPNTLAFEKSYILTAWIRNRPKSETIGIHINTYMVSNKNCIIKPSEGFAMETMFQIDCSYITPKEYTFNFNVFQPSLEGPLVMQSSVRIFETQLAATNSNTIYIQVIYGKTLYKILWDVPVKVKAKKIDIDKSLKELKKLRNTNKVFQKVLLGYTLLNEASKLKEKDNFILKSKVLNEMSAVKLDNPLAYNAMSQIIKLLKKEPFTKKYASKVNDFCSSIKNLPTHFDARYQDKNSEKFENQDAKKCLNEDLISQATLDSTNDVPITDGKLMEDEDILIENYPSYDEKFGDDIAQEAEDDAREMKLKKIINYAEKLKIGETIDADVIIISKYNTHDTLINKFDFKQHQAPKSFAGTYKYMDPFPPCKAIISTSNPVDPNSYLEKNKEIASTMVDITTICVQEDNSTIRLSVPVKISFNKVTTPKASTYTASFNLSADIIEWTTDYLNNKMIIYRLNTFKGHQVYAEFGNMTKNAKLKIAVTKNKRPDLLDFNKIYIVQESNTSTWVVNPEIDTTDDNCWIYIAILIDEDMLQEISSAFINVTFDVRMLEKSCILWNYEIRQWETELCQLQYSSNSNIECLCNHSSIFATKVLNVESVLDPYYPLIVNLKLKITNIIFCFVASVLFLYCITCCFAIKRTVNKSGMADIYFLADNLKNDLYAYLLIINTGNLKDAGTTSNVMIKIVGSLGVSKSHVLNYPDPDKILLQKDTEQWFILTVDKFLGEIISLDLWLDFVGYRPTWFCESIHIIDLQRHEGSYFYINCWLTILENCHYITVFPSKENHQLWNKDILNNFKFQLGARHTWNIFSKTHDRELFYIQRITILLSQILNVYVIVILFHGSPEMRMRDSFTIGFYDYSIIITRGIISGLLSFLINVAIVTIFRHTNGASSTRFLIIKKLFLPIVIKKYAWVFLIMNINISLIYLVTFGFWLPTNESVQWIASTTVGILVNIFVFENLFITLHDIFFEYYTANHVILQKYYQFRRIIEEVERQRIILYNLFGEFLLRPYIRQLYDMLPQEIVAEKKLWHTLRTNVARLFRDFIIFIVYFASIYILFVFTQDQYMIYQSNARLTNIIGKGSDDGGFPLKDIQNYNDIYDYIEFTVIPALNGRYWYTDWEMENAGIMSDFSTKVLGIAQVRQQRTDFDVCKIQLKLLNSSNLLCHSDYISTTNHFNKRYFKSAVWIYQSEVETNLPSVTGALRRYDGGGFIATLGRTEKNSQYVVNYLRRRKWLDINTQVVIIDFWAYNAYYNLFSIFQIIIERSTTGLILPNLKIFSAHLLHGENIEVELFYFITVVLLACVVVIIMFRELLQILLLRKKYFKDFWHYYDCVLITATLIAIFTFVQRSNMVKLALETIASANNNDFVLYFNLVSVSQSFVLLSSLVVCLATLRMWKYLRFWAIFQTLERTIVTSSLPLLIIALSIALIISAYGSVGHLLFGSEHSQMITFLKSNTLLFFLFLGFIEIDEHRKIMNFGYIPQLYKTSFMLISKLLFTVVTTIIIIYLSESKNFFSNRRDQFTIVDYLKEEYNYHVELFVNRKIRVRLRGGGLPVNSERRPKYRVIPELIQKELHFNPTYCIYPKSVKHRFARSKILPNAKLTLMRKIVIVILRRLSWRKGSKLQRTDHKAMANLLVNLIKRTEKNENKEGQKNALFYTKKTKNNQVKLLSDERLLDIEYVIQRLIDNKYFNCNREDNIISGDARKFSRISIHLKSLLQSINNFKFILDDFD